MISQEAYKRRIEAELKEWRAKINQIQAQAEKNKANDEIRGQINEMKDKLKNLENQFDSLKDKGEITSNNIKEAIMLYDNVAMYAPNIFLPQIIK